MANLNWTTKTNDVDDVLAEDFNNLVSSIETELDKKVDKVTGKGLIDTDVADNISIKNYGTNDVFSVATPEVDFKFVNAETINILTANDIHWGTNTTLQTELDKKVGFTDYATQTGQAGIMSIGTEVTPLGIGSKGVLQLAVVSTNEIDNRNNMHMWDEFPLGLGTLDYAVRSVRPEVSASLPDTLKVNTIYDLGLRTTLSIQLPNANYGEFIQVDFYSGETKTNLNIISPLGLANYDLIPEPNTMYSLFFDYGAVYATSTIESWGWRFGYAEYPYVEV